MQKPVLCLHRDAASWAVVHQGRTLGVVAAGDVTLDQALRIVQAADSEYDVRVWSWVAPKRDSLD